MAYHRYYRRKKRLTIQGFLALFSVWLFLNYVLLVSSGHGQFVGIALIFGFYSVLAYVAFRIFRFMFFKTKNPVSSASSGIVNPIENIPTTALAQGGDKYRLKPALVTYAEAEFMKILEKAAGSEYRVIPQVALASLVTPRNQNGHYIDYHDFNRIKAKSVDFVLYDKNWKPCVAIELDDSSHARPERIARDEFVRQVITEAGLPLLRIPWAYSYDGEALKAQISECLSRAEPHR